MEPKIIHEDDFLIVIDKPSGWIVNESETTKNQPVLQKWLYKNFNYPIAQNNELRSGIVHRLDKETSGVLLIGKTEISFRFLQNQFKKRAVNKEYMALVHGKVIPSEGNIKVPVGRLPWARKKFGIIPGGRESETHYSVISSFQFLRRRQGFDEMAISNEKFSLLELYPKTGRTHQIRIHLKYLGYPIVSDDVYAGRKTSRNDRKWCPRLFLHALGISFTHPDTRNVIKKESSLAYDLKNVLNSLEKIDSKN